MNKELSTATTLAQPEGPAWQRLPALRVWPAIVLVGFLWTVYFLLRWTELGPSLGFFVGFLFQVAATALVTLLFASWWLFNRRVSWRDRLLILGTAIAGGLLVALLCHKSLTTFALLMLSLPFVLASWTVCLFLARRWSPGTRRIGLLAALVLTWGAFLLIRQDGLWGNGQADIRWRWSANAEETYLVEQPSPEVPLAPAAPPSLQPGDWPGFRGPNRDSTVYGVKIATDWQLAPPKRVWQRRIGSAWSSAAVVNGRLFTQEQVGELEAVVCLDAATGDNVWVHTDAVRHWDAQGGPGPRATPTFAGGRLYTLGATGILNCLDAATGERKWFRDIKDDSGAKTPLWGFASSPLVVGEFVVVFAGGDSEKNLLAYRAASGDPVWAAAAGQTSYSSPQLAQIGGEMQILMATNSGVTAVAPASGEVLWHHAVPARGPGLPVAIQPHPLGTSQVVLDAGPDLGTVQIDVRQTDHAWTSAQQWISRQLKPSFSDFVVHEGFLYGFDGVIFSCLDLQTGHRRWKEGRYGSGQVLLLADQSLLLITTERGEVVLVAAKPAQHEELGRFQAINGKTWNHPVIAQDHLFVRNAEEIASYELVPSR